MKVPMRLQKDQLYVHHQLSMLEALVRRVEAVSEALVVRRVVVATMAINRINRHPDSNRNYKR